MIKLRIEGLPDEVEEFSNALRQHFEVFEESKDYPNRQSQFVRRYLTINYLGPIRMKAEFFNEALPPTEETK